LRHSRRGIIHLPSNTFVASLQQQRNDPEALIYLNNAKVHARNLSVLHIAVSVPIGSNLNVAQEILRGVAQAQDEINAKGGINQAGLAVAIADDANDPDLAKQIATAFVKNDQILGVIGHNASNASLAAAPIYQQGRLVMISPTSFAETLSGGSYIFRTVPATRAIAARLAEYVAKTAQKPDVVMCYDSQAPDNVSFKDEFVASFGSLGGRLVPMVCDFASPTFSSRAAIQEALSRGAKGLVLSPHVDRIGKAIELARVNQGQLPLFSSPSLYTIQTLKEGQSNISGLVLPAVWHPQTYPNSQFPLLARRRWGGEVSWRTAMSYDAAQALSTGLQHQTRSGLQQALRSYSFSAMGVGEAVRFDPQTGDRQLPIQLVKVQPTNSSQSGTGFDFVPVDLVSR